LRLCWSRASPPPDYLLSRLGPDSYHDLHASWGAASVDALDAQQVRALCTLVLQHEVMHGDDDDEEDEDEDD